MKPRIPDTEPSMKDLPATMWHDEDARQHPRPRHPGRDAGIQVMDGKLAATTNRLGSGFHPCVKLNEDAATDALCIQLGERVAEDSEEVEEQLADLDQRGTRCISAVPSLEIC